MKKNIWRLSTQPTVEEITTLLEKEVITKEEAKNMLFRNEEEVPKDQLREVKDELKLLRELVLAGIGQKEVKIIEKYYRDNWVKTPYYTTTNTWPQIYCSTANNTHFTTGTLTLGNTTIN